MANLKSKSVIQKMKKTSSATKTTERPVSSEQRYRMIAEAAYYRAEKRGFSGGDAENDWLEAETEIDDILWQQSESCKKGIIAKQDFQQKLEAQLKEWDDKFDNLQAKAKKAKAGIQSDIEKQISALTAKRETAQVKMHELRQRTEDTWEEMKSGAEKTWGEMHEALDRFISRFK